jgi:microcystin-dependent protein
MEPFIGEIRPFGFSYAPGDDGGWVPCDGRALSVQGYSSLYAVIGNIYGGNTQNFNVPDLQGRVPMGTGTGNYPGAVQEDAGSKSGQETVALTLSQIPSHEHGLQVLVAPPTTTHYPDPSANRLAGPVLDANNAAQAVFNPDATPGLGFSETMVGVSGQSAPHENRQPFLAFNFCIATTGMFPVRP